MRGISAKLTMKLMEKSYFWIIADRHMNHFCASVESILTESSVPTSQKVSANVNESREREHITETLDTPAERECN